MKYSGSNWIQDSLIPYTKKPDMVMSEIGRNVADLLGELFCGIYHLSNNSLLRVEWDNKYYIEISIGWRDWSTVDSELLTRLVFLAHHMAIRVELTPSKYNYMRLLFHQRNRSGDHFQSHPTLEQAVTRFKNTVSIPEYQETPEEALP